jgi:hypothetical protein
MTGCLFCFLVVVSCSERGGYIYYIWKALPGETLDDRLGENVRSFETVFVFRCAC